MWMQRGVQVACRQATEIETELTTTRGLLNGCTAMLSCNRYDTTMYAMSGLICIAAAANYYIRPIDTKQHAGNGPRG